MLRVMVDDVGRYRPAAVVVQRLSRIGIYIEAREVAAGDVHPNAVTLFEH